MGNHTCEVVEGTLDILRVEPLEALENGSGRLAPVLHLPPATLEIPEFYETSHDFLGNAQLARWELGPHVCKFYHRCRKGTMLRKALLSKSLEL